MYGHHMGCGLGRGLATLRTKERASHYTRDTVVYYQLLHQEAISTKTYFFSHFSLTWVPAPNLQCPSPLATFIWQSRKIWGWRPGGGHCTIPWTYELFHFLEQKTYAVC